MKNTSSSEEKLAKIKKINARLKKALTRCCICPRKCAVDRTKGVRGYCRALLDPVVYSFAPHHGEEPPISGSKGSGTIFFSSCSMKCVYCQNYDFSQLDKGKKMSLDELSGAMLSLQRKGCHNINLVTPTHFMPQILLALETAVAAGLNIPIVYNTSGYEIPEVINLLDGIVDIYLTDMRYSDDSNAKKYSDAPDYVKFNRASVIQMQRQVGDLAMAEDGTALRGLIVRLLVLPHDVSGTKETLKFISEKISENTHLSLMSQYYPTFKAAEYTELSKPVTVGEYKNMVDAAAGLGLNKGWVQDEPSQESSRYMGTNIKPGKEVK